MKNNSYNQWLCESAGHDLQTVLDSISTHPDNARRVCIICETERAAYEHMLSANDRFYDASVFFDDHTWQVAAPELLMNDCKDTYYLISSARYAYKTLSRLMDLGIARDRIILTKECKSGASGKDECFDVSLGYSRKDDLPGFHIHGKEFVHCPHRSILTLGGSTTDPTFNNLHSWPHYLQKFLAEAGIPCVIYNGGMAGYKASQELVKIIRDGIYLRPDAVISFSGTNNAWAKHWVGNTKFTVNYQLEPIRYARDNDNLIDVINGKKIDEIVCGIDIPVSNAEFWLDTERMMHAICTEFGIRFYGFLQPVSGYTDSIGDRRNDYHLPDEQYRERFAFYDDVRKVIAQYDYLTDLSTLLSNRQQLFTDVCHLTERGNIIVARQVLRKILPDLERLR